MKRTNDKIIVGEGDSMRHIQTNIDMSELIDLLKGSTLTNQIKKYVASELYLNKEDGPELIQIDPV